MSAAVTYAARDLRLAQRAYMADRGNDALGREVAAAAERLDEALEGHEPRAGQSRRWSALEAVLNVLIGSAVMVVGNAVCLPLVGLPAPSAGQHAGLAVMFTVISVARSYGVRRLFNRLGV